MRRCLLAFEPPDGGVAENVLRLALGLRQHGWEPFVAGPAQSIGYAPLSAAGVPIARLPLEKGYGHPTSDLRALRAFTGILRRHRFDVVHLHSAKAGVLGRLAARATATPAVYSPHCFPFVGPWAFPRRQFSRAVERALGSMSHAILCAADEERRLALELGIAPWRLFRVNYGTEPCPIGVEAAPELRTLAAQGPLAATIAVLRPQKAIDVFVDAAPRILAECPDAHLAVVGNGELRGALEQRALDLGLDTRFRFFDFSPPPARFLRLINIFVLPSAWEALPISVLEAMACGVPQVATDVGGTREAVSHGETGLLCPPNDPAALADCVVELLRDPARRERMADASRTRHGERFGVGRMIAETAAVYDRVAA